MNLTSLPLNEIDPRGDLKLRVGANRTEQDSTPKCFLVCSRTIARVSPVFDRMLNGSFAEARREDGKEWIVDLPYDNPSAMELFLNLSHGHAHKAPRSLSTHELYDLTLLTHFYDATQVLAPWILPWIGSLEQDLLTSVGDDDAALPQMLYISWELGHRQVFEATMRRITMEGLGSMFVEGSVLRQLQMPTDVVERICAVRDETIDALLDVMRSFTELLTVVDERPRWCRHATFMGPHRCESMILGSITFSLTRAGLFPLPADARGVVKHSILGLYVAFSNLVIHDIGQPGKGDDDHRVCNPQEYLVGQMDEVMANIQRPVNGRDRELLDAQAKRLHML